MEIQSSSNASTEIEREEFAALRAISEGTARAVGEDFLRSLVQHLAAAMHVRHAFIAEFCGEHRVRTLAYWHIDRIAGNVEFDVIGTPCEDVVKGSLCHYPCDVMYKFPGDRPLVEMKIQSYLGVPLVDASGKHLGHLAVFDENPMPREPMKLFIFNIFAARAAAELERIRFEKLLSESEERYRDLYEHAPTAYVHCAADGTLLAVNDRMCEMFGTTREQLVGSRLCEAIVDPASQDPREGIEVQLARADGEAIWVSVWDRPVRDRDGRVTSYRAILADITDRVLMQREKDKLEQQNIYLKEEIRSVFNFDEIVGQGPAVTAALQSVRQVARTDSTVLLLGETGTGKELFARAIHSASMRKDKPLIKVNCAALPAGLVESELFGHERGAFSGAIGKRIGRFELADGGTIFLDEIGELPLDLQSKLLRVLQEREFERVGGSGPIHVDVRVVAATNRDLLKNVEEGKFRQDLYYRLNVFPIRLPPLRERTGDIPQLAQFLVAKHATRIGKRLRTISDSAIKALCAYPWPGNVREMENVLERALILSSGEVLEVPPDLLASADSPPAKPKTTAPKASPAASGALDDVRRNHILKVLSQTNWVIEGPNGAAQMLSLHPNTLRSRMKKLGIERVSGQI